MQELSRSKLSLITGGSSGTGLAIAKKFTRNNLAAVVADKAKTNILPKNISFKCCDVTSAADLEDLYQCTSETMRVPDLRVNNAGRGKHEKLSGGDPEKKGAKINLQYPRVVLAGLNAVIEANFYGTKGGLVLKNTNGSFYGFQDEKYKGTQTEILVATQMNGIAWAKKPEARSNRSNL